MYLAQGHNTVTPVRLELLAPWSGDKHSTTEPLGSPNFRVTRVHNGAYKSTFIFDTAPGVLWRGQKLLKA